MSSHGDERPPVLLGSRLHLGAEGNGRDLVITRARAAAQIHAAGGVVDVILIVNGGGLDRDLVVAREVQPIDDIAARDIRLRIAGGAAIPGAAFCAGPAVVQQITAL